MNILRKILAAIRGGAREVGELVVDANGTRIFEQEIRDAREHLNRAKQDLTEVMAKQMQSGRQLEHLKGNISEHESYARAALQKGNQPLALEVAEKISSLEVDLADQQEVYNNFSAHADRLKQLVKKTERQIREYDRQLTMVRTTESVQKASAAITDSFSSTNSKMLGARESLERIKKRQQDEFDRLQAAEEIEAESTDAGLAARLQQAGIGKESHTAEAVLERLRYGGELPAPEKK